MKNRFEEIKIEMVMKLKKIGRKAAVEEIARSGIRYPTRSVSRDRDDLLSAEEFFVED